MRVIICDACDKRIFKGAFLVGPVNNTKHACSLECKTKLEYNGDEHGQQVTEKQTEARI